MSTRCSATRRRLRGQARVDPRLSNEGGGWPYEQGRAVGSSDGPASGAVLHERDSFGVHLLVMTAAEQDEVRKVRRPGRPVVDVMRFAPASLAFAAGDDAAAVAADQRPTLAG